MAGVDRICNADKPVVRKNVLIEELEDDRRKKPSTKTKAIDQALQGGGAHGALTWGGWINSADRLRNHLKLESGPVTLPGAVNDEAGAVSVVVDKAIRETEALRCHPLVNSSIPVISLENIFKFLDATFWLFFQCNPMHLICRQFNPYKMQSQSNRRSPGHNIILFFEIDTADDIMAR